MQYEKMTVGLVRADSHKGEQIHLIVYQNYEKV